MIHALSFCRAKEKAEPKPTNGAAASGPHDSRISSAADSIAHPWSVYNSFAYKGNAQYSHASAVFIVLSPFFYPSIYTLRKMSESANRRIEETKTYILLNIRR